MSRHFTVVGPGVVKTGIVAATFDEFLKKVRRKLKLKHAKDITVCLSDQTQVDEEYFEVLSSGTELHVMTDRDTQAQANIHNLATFLHTCMERQPQVHNKIMGFLHEPKTPAQTATLLKLLVKVTERETLVLDSERNRDADWFKGLNTKYQTKEEVMRNSAETRMRGYLDRTKRELITDLTPPDSPCRAAIQYFKENLSKCRYNASYFDRRAGEGERLCDGKGVFGCQGPYNQTCCPSLHLINPYASRENRIVFSTWNLDHMIEKSREILPVLKSSLSSARALAVNLSYFQDLLFNKLSKDKEATRGNLKLVHIACHVKKCHELKCQPEKVYHNTGQEGQGEDSTDSLAQLLQPPTHTILESAPVPSQVKARQEMEVPRPIQNHTRPAHKFRQTEPCRKPKSTVRATVYKPLRPNLRQLRPGTPQQGRRKRPPVTVYYHTRSKKRCMRKTNITNGYSD